MSTTTCELQDLEQPTISPTAGTSTTPDEHGQLHRRTVDKVLIGFGVVATNRVPRRRLLAPLGQPVLERLRQRRAVIAEHLVPATESLEQGRTDLPWLRR